MKTKPFRMFLVLGLLVTGCGRHLESPRLSDQKPARLANPLAIALAPHEGGGKLDAEIRRVQEQARRGKNPAPALERLGWLFVAKGRESFDPGFYNLAEQCALGLEAKQPHQPEALLLRGHALQNLHRFKEAEPLARELVAQRGRAFDYGLLGDVLMEQGRLVEAVEAYQRMADLKPDLHAYTRAAHVRWLKGDLTGAIEMMQLAVQAASPRDPETSAWVCSRMAQYQLLAGDLDQAAQHCAAALEFQPEYAPALLVRGRLLLAQGRNEEAAVALTRAATLNPVPEYQWVLVEASRAAGRDVRAMESLLKKGGATADPRTFAPYLATCGEDPGTAVRLSKAELNTRTDVFTHDAVAWALAAAGHWEEASAEMRQALAEGTRDARLFLHAGIIASELAQPEEAKKWLRAAAGAKQMLLPSEQAKLAKYETRETIPAQLSVPEEANLKTERNKNNQIQKGRS